MAVTRDDQQGKLQRNATVAAPTGGQRQAPLTPPADAVANGPAKVAAEPAAPQVQQKPVPVLLQHGFTGGIDTFNQRVQSVHDQFSNAYGFPPSPGLTLDLAKSNLDPDQFGKMFTVPADPTIAKNRAVAVQHGYDPDSPVITSAKQVAADITKAAYQGNYKDYITENHDLIHQLSYESKQGASTIAAALFKARRYTAQRDLAEKVADGTITSAEATGQLRAEGFLPGSQGVFKDPKGLVGGVATAFGQITDSLVHSPAGLYEVGKAAGLDVNDAYFKPPGQRDMSFRRTRAIGKAVGVETANDFEHPTQNPGHLFLDALGLLTAGAGIAVRTTAAVGAVGEVADDASVAARVGAAAKGFARKPDLQRVALDYDGYKQEALVSQNPLVAAAQKMIARTREARANNALEAADVPAGLRSVLIPDRAQDLLDKNFSFPTKLRREAEAQARVDHIVKTSLSRELDHLAGRSIMQARIHAAMPSKIRGALTRGEQKAIQVLSWDDPNPLQAERDFHTRMLEYGIGDPKAHQRQLADLKLAEKALANPSPRFRQALALTQRVIAEQERIKIQDLGLLPETAEGRVAHAAAVLRGEDFVPAEKLTDESFYMPTQRRGKVKRLPSDQAGFYQTKAGPFGVPPGRDLPELTHEFTGKALQAGDYRIDATSLASESYARTVRLATIRAEHAKLWDAAHDTPRSRWDVPIRDANAIPDKLREIVARLDEGDFTEADAQGLPPDAADLIRELYPEKLTQENIDGVKWIDKRLIGGSLPKVPNDIAKAASLVNTPFRFAALYLRPAYILNKLGNHAMLWFDQGIHTVPNFIKAMSAETRYGEENARTIRELVGAGRSHSYVTSESGKAANAVADFWNRVADRDERVTAFIYYMERKGYKSRGDVDRLLHDDAAKRDLSEITRRANKSLVEFDNLTEFEKNTLRHFIFVYPWVSRSAVYSIRAILDHPIRAGILSKLGQMDYEQDPLFKQAPGYFKRIGYIPLGFNHDGTVKVVNPTSINTFSTLGDFMALTRAATQGDKYASAEDFLGPFPTYMIHATTGRDEFGNKYPDSQWLDAAKEVLVGLPQISAAQKAANYKKGSPRPVNIADRASLEASLNANLKKSVLSPGWLDGYGSLLAGGLTPRNASLPAEAARYWRDQDPKVRHQRELDLLNRALDMQGEALGKPVPADVRSAVAHQAEIDYGYKNFLKQTGRAPTDKERASFTIGYLSKQGLISKGQAAEFQKTLAPLADPTDINRLKNTLLDRYANGKALRQWDTDIRAYASFTPEIINQKAAELYNQGLSDQRRFNVPQAKLEDYGRKFVEFTHQVKALRAEIKAGTKTSEDLKAFQDQNDKPVDGLPSFVRIAWANQTPAERQQAISSAATASWNSLSAFDKTLLGRPTGATVTAGWAELGKLVAQQQATLKREGRSFPAGYKRQLAQYVEKYYDTTTGKFEGSPKQPPTGLVKDFDFGKQPLFERMKMYAPIQKSPNHGLWVQLLNLAKDTHKYLVATDANGRHLYKAPQVRQMWSDYVNSTGFQAWIGEHPSFKQELDGYGRHLLVKLVG